MNLLLGKLYVNEGLQNKAEESYTTALRQNPYALEAALALTELAAAKDASPDAFAGSDGTTTAKEKARSAGIATVRQHEIERFYADFAATPSAPESGVPRVDALWMQSLVAAHMDAERGNYRSASMLRMLDHLNGKRGLTRYVAFAVLSRCRVVQCARPSLSQEPALSAAQGGAGD
jgi:hypothetical protein